MTILTINIIIVYRKSLPSDGGVFEGDRSRGRMGDTVGYVREDAFGGEPEEDVQSGLQPCRTWYAYLKLKAYILN